MSEKTTPSEATDNSLPFDSYDAERFFPHLFRLTLLQLRLQRAVIGFLAGSAEPEKAGFCSSLKESVIAEKRDVRKLLQMHLVKLKYEFKAPDAIVGWKQKEIDTVEARITELESENCPDCLKDLIRELDRIILSEYLDLVTQFSGEDSNWPIAFDEESFTEFMHSVLRS